MNHTFTEFINKISQYLLQIPRNSDAFFWVSEFNNLNTTNIQLTRIDTDNVSAISSSDPAKEMSLTRRVKFTTHLLEQQLDPSFQAFDADS
mmetsp:Transcript_39736/g.51233  ORF Transcript_39736/g.51233 Transcript_39736/m.51233 type:complete len:91 (-) Transcript_39736:234-506(-)